MTVEAAAPRIESREELIQALQAASVVEQMLCCEYLYAAFTIRRTLADFPEGTPEETARVTIDRATPWLSQLYLVARQEMEHLGIVCNLLAAIDADPYFDRPDFPQPASHSVLGVPYCLDRFGRSSMRRFIWYERPSYLTPSFAPGCSGLDDWCAERTPALPGRESQFETVEELYDQIALAFETLPDEKIFVGDPDRQVGALFSHRVQMVGVGNRQEAAEAIRQILAEGEAMGMNPLTSTCHFERFTQILTGYEQAAELNPQFDPAMPAVTNPLLKPHADGFPVSRITDPHAAAAMALFNGSYHTMLVMLKTFFATYSRAAGTGARGSTALFYGAFFPLMTMVIRPLGELLCRMPAGSDFPGETAGASFELDEPVEVQLEVDYYRDRLQGLIAKADEVAGVVPDRLRPVARGLHENLTSTCLHLEHIWKNGL